jgi:hypothetical protein
LVWTTGAACRTSNAGFDLNPFAAAADRRTEPASADGRACCARRNVAVNSKIYEWIMNISEERIVLLSFINMNSGT